MTFASPEVNTWLNENKKGSAVSVLITRSIDVFNNCIDLLQLS